VGPAYEGSRRGSLRFPPDLPIRLSAGELPFDTPDVTEGNASAVGTCCLTAAFGTARIGGGKAHPGFARREGQAAAPARELGVPAAEVIDQFTKSFC
jgi:hypothetical protein